MIKLYSASIFLFSVSKCQFNILPFASDTDDLYTYFATKTCPDLLMNCDDSYDYK